MSAVLSALSYTDFPGHSTQGSRLEGVTWTNAVWKANVTSNSAFPLFLWAWRKAVVGDWAVLVFISSSAPGSIRLRWKVPILQGTYVYGFTVRRLKNHLHYAQKKTHNNNKRNKQNHTCIPPPHTHTKHTKKTLEISSSQANANIYFCKNLFLN